MHRVIAVAITAFAVWDALPAYAEEPEAAPSLPGLAPPRLLYTAEPVYPASKLGSGESAIVDLILTLSSDGSVQDASLAGSAEGDFDEPAIAAGRQARFAPATRDGVPVPARVGFRVEFSAPVAAQPIAREPEIQTPASPPVVVAPESPSTDTPSLDVDVEGERPPREVTLRSLTAEEVRTIPGTNGDALRSVQNMPGVARVGAFTGQLIVRGSSPRDTRVFFDGTGAPLVYHFGGLSSVVPSEVLERIDFYPGNFGPQYGRATGGIVDVGVRSPRKDRLGGLLQVDLVDARVLVEGPINDSTRFMLGGRRSWLDAWIGPVLSAAGVGVTTAPVYYDYQAMLEHDVTRNVTGRLFFFGSDDSMKLALEPDASDPALGGDSGLHQAFWRVQARLDARSGSALRSTTTASVGYNESNARIAELFTDFRVWTVEARSDLRLRLAPFVTAIAGVDFRYEQFDSGFRLPALNFEDSQNSPPVFGRPLTTIHATGTHVRPAGYAMLELTPFAGLKLLPGIRSDYDASAKTWTADPRVSVRYDAHAEFPRTTVKGGAGIFHQPPEGYETVKPFGNDGVHSEVAYHYSLGLEQELARSVEVSVELFYKDLRDIVVSVPSLDRTESGVTYENRGSGRSYGGELLLRFKPGGRFWGWLAYTLSRSERRDSERESYYRYDYDQSHILTAIGSYDLGRGWQVGARFRYVTGNLYTPVIGGTLDYDAGVYAPLSSTDRNSARVPAFHQLDLRVDKTWRFQGWSLSAYLDLQNTYNYRSTEDIGYNFDYSQTTPTRGLPILPIVGVRGEL